MASRMVDAEFTYATGFVTRHLCHNWQQAAELAKVLLSLPYPPVSAAYSDDKGRAFSLIIAGQLV